MTKSHKFLSLAAFLVALAVAVFFGCSSNENNPSFCEEEDCRLSSPASSTTTTSSSSASSSSDYPGSSSDSHSSSSGTSGSSSSSHSSSSASPGSSSGSHSSSSNIAPGTYPKLQEGQSGVQKGKNTRYWDACRPHCTLPENAWKGTSYNENNKNVPQAAFDMISKVCNKNDVEVPAYFWYDEWNKWFSDNSSCSNDKPVAGGIDLYTCWDQSPIAVNDTLAYAFAAVSGTLDNKCGKCYQIQFTGKWSESDHVGASHAALNGKTLIVLASNIGHDVGGAQFDIMIPGGGLGAYDAFSPQLEISPQTLGAKEGGLLTSCDQEGVRFWDSSVEDLQTCVRNKCNAVFGNKSPKLLNGCLWMADWYMAADNPEVLYKELDECPQYLVDKYRPSVFK